ncbi:MAG: DUF6067 family protein, partial [Methylococcales bacterium]|nr:DUF6067 family protein [Methylococcales bacterium]
MNIFIKNKTDKKLLNIIVFMFFFIASITAYAVEPTLYASFDNDLNAVRGSVKIPAGSVLFPSLKKGKYGNALESGLLKGYITYPTNNVINVNEGTVELWVNPVDWTPDDNNFHVFFDVRGQGAFYLYKYYQDSKLLMLSTLDRGNGPYYSSSKIVTWKQGEWHHIAGTWSASGILLYVDGVPVSSQPVDAIFPKNLEESFTIGDIPWSSITSTKSLIDELRIYDKALTPRQILAHYNNDFNSNVFSEAAIKTSYVINKKDGVIDYSFSSDTPLNDKKLDVKLEVKKNNSSVYKSEFTLDNSKNDTNQYVPLKDFSPGEYTLISSVFLDGKLLTTKEMSVVIPDEAWLSDKNVKTTDLEMSAVPKPWTPLSISENVLDLWGRQYSFVESALPNQLASNGKNLLSAPISIAAKSLFNTTTLKSTPAVFNLNAQKSQVEITSKFYKSNIDETVLYVTNKTEFDGLSTITLTVPVSKNSLSNESLIIDIPLENVKYKHKWEEWGQWNKD